MALTQVKAAGLEGDVIDETKLANNSIDSEHYNAASIDNEHLADDAVGLDELSATGTASSSTYLRGDNSWTVPPDTNTQLSTEAVQDIVGAMFTGNTETNISATYEDSDGTIDLVSTDTNTQLSTEAVQDIVGGMFTGNTETNISATYQDTDGTIDLVSTDTVYTHPNHSGDVTSSGDGATTIANNAVTLDKMAGLARGKLIVGDSNGDPSALAAGSDNHVLTMDANGDCGWEAAAGGVDGISSSADANAITIDSSEHVIVGGTTVNNVHTNNQDFVVGNSSNSNTGMALNCASGGYCSIVMSDSAGDKNKGLIAFNHADDSFKFVVDPASGLDNLKLTSSNVELPHGNLVIGTAGKGIDFSAQTAASTTGSSATAEILDHYEEGTWTPDPYDGTCSHEHSRYIRVGSLVTIWTKINNFSDRSTNDMVKIQGLPFAISSSMTTLFGTAISQYNNEAPAAIHVMISSFSMMLVYGADSGGLTQMRHNDLNNSLAEVHYVCTYRTG